MGGRTILPHASIVFFIAISLCNEKFLFYLLGLRQTLVEFRQDLSIVASLKAIHEQ